MRKHHRDRFGDFSYALGGYSVARGGGGSSDGPVQKWKPDIEAVRATTQFAKETGRLLQSTDDEAGREGDINERLQLSVPVSEHA
jgi:hypothetical protein